MAARYCIAMVNIFIALGSRAITADKAMNKTYNDQVSHSYNLGAFLKV